ncbi:MAG: shikimate dehydrogenase [Gemmatimonadota bacterium]|nr:shikimate dehydrogenase [Gemmatimonadota bacterium]
MTSVGTRVFALLGDPVAHSLSPVMQGAAFRALGLDVEYRALRVPADRPGRVAPIMRTLAGAGGGGNVTVPHKQVAARALDAPDADVTATGACNTFWRDAEARLAGANTDVGGILRSLEELGTLRLGGAEVLVLGAGGAGRAAVVACARGGARRIEIRNRSRARAELLASELGARLGATGAKPEVVVGTWDGAGGDFDLAIQATSLGLRPGDPLPPGLERATVRHALDLVYRPPDGTAWVRHARRRGVPVLDGLRPLLHQGALGLRHWTGAEPGPEVLAAMERALAAVPG